VSIWFVLWVIISVALLYFSGWTYLILYRQKKAWKAFSAKHKLRYIPGKFTDAPQIKGVYSGYEVHIFSSEHQSPDVRGSRKLTAIEIDLKSKAPVNMVAASSGMVSMAEAMGLPSTVMVEHDSWADENLIQSDNADIAQAYFTPARLTALQKVIAIKNSMVIFVFRPQIGLFRIDLSDPLDNEEKEERLLKNLIKVVEQLELDDGESSKLKSVSAKKAKATPVLDVSDSGGDSGLSLEED